MRDSAFGPADIPPEFWTRPDVTRALARQDIGELFRLLKKWTGMSQTRIGAATGLYQGRVSYIINGKYQVTSLKSLAGIADGLHMPGSARATLGLAPGPADQTGPPHADKDGLASRPIPGAQYPATAEQAVSATAALWRADSARCAGGHFSRAGACRLEQRRAGLAAQSARQHSARCRNRIGGRPADVARVRASTELFAELDNRFGGAHARRSLIHFLDRDAAALLTGRYTDETGRELFDAVAEASLLAAWTSYDCGLHGLAQRYFVQALRLAQSAADRRLACSVMSAMSHQATYLGHLPEAVNLARAAREGLRDQATPALTAQFLTMEARALASSGDTHGCHSALAAVERAFQVPEPGVDPEFISYFNEAELAAETAHCFRDLGDARRSRPPRRPRRPVQWRIRPQRLLRLHGPGRRTRRPRRPRTGMRDRARARCASVRP